MRGRMKRERQSSDLAVIGDRVELERLPDGTGAIVAVEPRTHRFSRRQPGPRGTWREDVIVANPDLVAIVFACDRPPPNPRLIDRFLVVAEYNEVPAILVANKTDLVGADAARERFGVYERIGYDVLYTSARARIGLEELRGTARGTALDRHRAVGCRKVDAAQRDAAGAAAGDRRRQRGARPSGPPHDDARRAASDRRSRRRIRRRHARHPRAGPLPDPGDRAGVVLPGIPRAPRTLCLRRLHAPARAALRASRRRRGRGRLGGPI